MIASSVFSFVMVAAALILLGAAVHAWPQRHTREGYFFTGMLLAAALFAFTSGVEALADVVVVKIFWAKIEYIGLAAAVPLWYMFVLDALDRGPEWTPARLARLWAMPLLALALAWTNEWHGWVWERLTLFAGRGETRLVYTHGPAAWIFAGYAYLLLVFGSVQLIHAARQVGGMRRKAYWALALAAFFPFLGNLIYLLGWSPWPGIDLTPLGLALTGMITAFAQLRLPLFEALPAAENALFDSLSDLVVVLDRQDRVLKLNSAAQRELGLEDARPGCPLGELHPGLADLAARMRPDTEGRHDHAEWEQGAGDALRVFDVRMSPRFSTAGVQPGRPTGRVFTLREVTRERRAVATIARRARQMELLSAITQSALDQPNLQALLQSVADRLAELFEAQSAYLTTWDDDLQAVHPAAASGERAAVYLADEFQPDRDELTRLALAGGRPLAVASVLATCRPNGAPPPVYPDHACLALPLIAGQARLGAAVVVFRQPHAFDEEQIALGEQVARVIALVISKARLYESERWRLAELTALQSIGAAVASSLNLQDVFDTAVRLLHETFGYGLIGVYRMDGDELVLMAQLGYDLKVVYRRIDLHEGVIGRAVRTRTLQFVRDVDVDPDYRSAGEAVRYEICAPLLKDDRVLGALNIENPAERPFTENDVRLMQAFAVQLAVAITNAELYTAEHDQRELAEALREIGLALSETLDLDALLDRILENIRRVTPYDAALFMLTDEDGRRAVVSRRTGYSQFGADVDAEISALVLDLSLYTFQRLIHSGPFVLPNVDDEPRWTPTKASRYLKAWAGAPVFVNGRAAAFITVEHCRPGFYHAGHLPALAAIASQAGAAFQNARLFRELREQVQREQRLFAATRDFTSRLGETAVLDAVSHHMLEALQADACTLSHWEPDADRVVTVHNASRSSEVHQEPVGTTYPLADYPVTRQVIEDRQPVFLHAADPHTDPGERAVMETFGAGMVLISPLAAGREAPVYGLVELYRVLGGREFSASELELARNLTAQAAQAIENSRLFAEVQRLAVMDELTGLYNRRGFFELGRREHERATRYQHSLSAVFLDIDHFKLFNDAFSYAVGDQALRLVANCLRETTRETDLLGRYGGEEFVALLPETDLKAALYVAERIRKAVARLRVKTGFGDVNLTVSIGVHQNSAETPTLDHLIDCAGQALHTAKARGRNRVAGD